MLDARLSKEVPHVDERMSRRKNLEFTVLRRLAYDLTPLPETQASLVLRELFADLLPGVGRHSLWARWGGLVTLGVGTGGVA